MPDVPTWTNGGGVLLVVLLAVIVLGAVMRRPPVYRCECCGALFAIFVAMDAHEVEMAGRS